MPELTDRVQLVLSVLGTAAQIPSIAWAGTSSRMEASSFSGLLTRVEIGQIPAPQTRMLSKVP